MILEFFFIGLVTSLLNLDFCYVLHYLVLLIKCSDRYFFR